MKDKLIPRAYRIRKDQDSAIKRKAKKDKIGQSELIRQAIDKEVGIVLQ